MRSATTPRLLFWPTVGGEAVRRVWGQVAVETGSVIPVLVTISPLVWPSSPRVGASGIGSIHHRRGQPSGASGPRGRRRGPEPLQALAIRSRLMQGVLE